MSLKAKIEAVIYASEEPVTLAQLIGLLGEEGQAELDVLAANQLSLGTAAGDGDTALDQDNLNAEVLDTADDTTDRTAEAEAAEVKSSETQITAEVESAENPLTSEVSSRPESALHADAAERPASGAATETPAAPDAKLLATEQKLATRRLRDYFRSLLDQLIADYANSDRGLEVKEVASGFRFATKPEYHDAVRGFVKSLKPPLKLSLQALETLAVVAYKQPVTAPEVSEIRGVESAGTLGSLLTRKLVTTAGRKQVIGRPILYKTTKDFLLRFGLKDINELPSIEEFEKMAGELNEAVQEEIAMEAESDMQESTNANADLPTEVSSRLESSHSEDEMESGVPGERSLLTGVQRPASSEATEPSPDSAPLDERNAVPEPTHQFHDTPEDLMSDRSTSPEGHKHEPSDSEHKR